MLSDNIAMMMVSATHVSFYRFILLAIHLVTIMCSPSDCFRYSDILSMHNCLSEYFAKKDTLTVTEWQQMLPTDAERSQYKQHSYCIIVEKNLLEGKNIFRRSWGYVIIADDSWSKRNIFHSAPHFQSDLHTDREAAMIFNMSRSRAVVIAGASRFAVENREKSPCVTAYYAADSSHDNRTMFFVANSAMFAHQGASCPHDSCAFIQWHGMAAGSCPDANAFISTGINNAHNTYNVQNLPANKIVAAFNQLGAGIAKTPRDSACDLVAAENVFGRLINGVTSAHVCDTFATSTKVTGSFVHIEQEPDLRTQFDRWTQTINAAFPL